MLRVNKSRNVVILYIVTTHKRGKQSNPLCVRSIVSFFDLTFFLFCFGHCVTFHRSTPLVWPHEWIFRQGKRATTGWVRQFQFLNINKNNKDKIHLSASYDKVLQGERKELKSGIVKESEIIDLLHSLVLWRRGRRTPLYEAEPFLIDFKHFFLLFILILLFKLLLFQQHLESRSIFVGKMTGRLFNRWRKIKSIPFSSFPLPVTNSNLFNKRKEKNKK